MRPRVVLAALAALIASLALAAPASARWFPTDPRTSGQTNSTLSVDSTANIAKDGMSVTWGLQFTCPAGTAYSGIVVVEELNPPQIPELYGEDNGVPATGSLSRTCTVHQQHV